MSDRRDQQLHFRVSKPELERIRNKMESSGILSITILIIIAAERFDRLRLIGLFPQCSQHRRTSCRCFGFLGFFGSILRGTAVTVDVQQCV